MEDDLFGIKRSDSLVNNEPVTLTMDMLKKPMVETWKENPHLREAIEDLFPGMFPKLVQTGSEL